MAQSCWLVSQLAAFINSGIQFREEGIVSGLGHDRIHCKIWNNGRSGWGVKIPELTIRKKYFDRRRNSGKVAVEVDGCEYGMNVDKDSFWNETCGELIHKSIREYADKRGLKPGDSVFLHVLEPWRRFRLDVD